MRRLDPTKQRHGSASHRHQRSWWRSRSLLRRIFIVLIILLGLAVLGAVGWFFYGGTATKIEEQARIAATNLSVKMGLNLQHIYLEGKHFTKSEKIISALGVKIGQPLLTIPLEDIKKRLEKLDWIKSAVIERQLPTTLHVRIVERTPIALWQNAGQLYLIDEDGTLIVEDNLAQFNQLLILVGGDAPLYANHLLTMLRKDMELFKLTTSAIRVGERRWNIRLAENIEIKLPEEEPDVAWQHIIKMFQDKKLFHKNIRSIDLRVQGKVFINMSKTPPAATKPLKSQTDAAP